MSALKVQTIDSAPEGSKKILEQVEKKFGFIPNLMGVFAGSPTAVKAYTTLSEIFGGSSLSPTEQQVILMTANAKNGCEYCMAAHSVIAQGSGVPGGVIKELRENEGLSDPKLNALREFTLAVIRERGWVSDETIERFKKAGWTDEAALDVIVGVSLKTLSNYTNHIAETPLDEAFAGQKWSKRAAAAV